MSDRYGRIQLLLSQNRHEMAERDLRLLLAEEPRDATAHALLAIALLHDRKRWQESTEAAQAAVGLEPDEAFSHYALAISLLTRNHFPEAQAAIEESIRLDPYDADAFAVLIQTQLSLQHFQLALEAADQGLAIDPENIDCGNLRSVALESLGRGDEAIAAAGQTLKRDPDDPMSHAAHGIALLNTGRYEEAQRAFREALRLDPDNEIARLGMIQALNNRSFVFRLVHRFYVMLARLGDRGAFTLVLGAWLLIQVLTRVVVPAVPALGPLIMPIVLLYVAFVVLTWVASPLFNTFLRFHPFGRHLLDAKQRWASDLIAPCLGLALFGLVAGGLHGNVILALLAMCYWFGLAIPISATFAMATPKRMVLVGACSIVLALLPVIGVIKSVVANDPGPFYETFRMFGWGLLAVQIASNFLAVKTVRS